MSRFVCFTSTLQEQYILPSPARFQKRDISSSEQNPRERAFHGNAFYPFAQLILFSQLYLVSHSGSPDIWKYALVPMSGIAGICMVDDDILCYHLGLRMNGLGHSRLWSDMELHCAGWEW